MDAITQ